MTIKNQSTKPIPYLMLNWPIMTKKALKPWPLDRAAHTYAAYIREYLPPSPPAGVK